MYMHSLAQRRAGGYPAPGTLPAHVLLAAPGAFAGAAGQWISHTQAEIRRGRWGFLPPVLCFKFVMAGRPWAGHAAVLILVAGSQKKMQKQAEAK